LQLSSCSAVGVSEIQAFVEREPDVGLVYSATVRYNSSGLSSSSSFVCCQFAPWVEALGGNRSQRAECSAGHGHSRDPSPSGHGGACLLVDSSRGTRGDGFGKLQLDATLALSAYLGWVSGAPEKASDGEEIVLHTQGECAGESDNTRRLCWLHVGSAGTKVVRALARMDLDRSLLTPREFKLAMRLSSNSASGATGSGRLDGTANSLIVTLSNPEIHQGQSTQALSARVGEPLGRRSLRVSTVTSLSAPGQVFPSCHRAPDTMVEFRVNKKFEF